MKATIYEMGLRDGLQNESLPVNLVTRKNLVTGLIDAGMKNIELGAFVRADKIPQMAPTAKLFTWVNQAFRPSKAKSEARFWALVPNRRGFEIARQNGVRNFSLLTAASDRFNQANIGLTVQESIDEIRAIAGAMTAAERVQTRVYISTAFACPYSGWTAPEKVVQIVEQVKKIGYQNFSIGDTIGIANPTRVRKLIRGLKKMGPPETFALHLHDTRGTALANVSVALEEGFFAFDSSIGGLGGCPYAPGASGNLATEDLLQLLHAEGLNTEISLAAICELSAAFHQKLGRPVQSKVLRAYMGQFLTREARQATNAQKKVRRALWEF